MAPLNSFDFEVMHSYAGGNPPSQDLDTKWIPETNSVVGNGNQAKPIMATECGYHTAIGNHDGLQPGVSEKAQAKYIPRLYFEYFNRGIVRAYTYELLDEFPANHNPVSEAFYGIIRHDGSHKPAYSAIKNLFSLLSDPGNSFTTGNLDYTLSGDLANVHHTLLEKRNHTFYLVFWLEVQSFDLKSITDIIVPPQNIKLSINTPVLLIRWAQYQPNQQRGPISSGTSTTISISVPDELLIVEIML